MINIYRKISNILNLFLLFVIPVATQMRATNSVSTVTTLSNVVMNNRTSSAPIISSVYSQRGNLATQSRPVPPRLAPVQTMTVGNTTVRTSAAPSTSTLRTYQTTPKIVGSTSLNPLAPAVNRPPRPALIPAPRPPAARPQGLPARNMRPTRPPPLINKGLVSASTAATTSSVPPRQVGGTTIRPIAVNSSNGSPVQGMETTSTINAQSDKDPNNNKTFPSLVVNVKPCLQERPAKAVINNARVDLGKLNISKLNGIYSFQSIFTLFSYKVVIIKTLIASRILSWI